MMLRFQKTLLLAGLTLSLPMLAISQNNNEQTDPFANPFSSPGDNNTAAPANPFGAPAQPANNNAPNNTAPANPFGAPAQPAANNNAPANPFGSPAAPANNNAPASDPFSQPSQPANNNAAPANPFGAPAQPTNNNNNAQPANPFGAPAAPVNDNNAAPANPFGAPAQPAQPSGNNAQPANPFGAPAAPSNNNAQPANPFGAPAAPSNNNNSAPANPFGAPGSNNNTAGGNTAAPANPFGAPGGNTPTTTASPTGGTGAPANPFGAPTGNAPSNTAGTSGSPSSPFGGTTTAGSTSGAPTSPFGGTTNNPFAEDFSELQDPFPGDSDVAGFTAGSETSQQSIDQLFDFRYEVVTKWDGTRFVVRRQLTAEEAELFDDRAKQRLIGLAGQGQLPGYDGSTPPDIWADWAHYADQLELWSRYIDRTVLAGLPSDEENTAYAQVQWPGTPPEPNQNNNNNNQGPQSGQNNIINEASSTSLDDQTSNLIFGPSDGGGGNQGQQNIFGPEVLTNQIVDIYNAKVEELRTLEQTQETEYKEFIDRLAKRKTRRLAYADWIDDQERQIEEAVLDWDRKYNGRVANIGGVRYELYRPGQVPENVQRDAIVVVTDFALTPYDILNPEDGTLKE